MTDTRVTYGIHPAIGVARVGNSRDCYIGPEAAGGLPENPDGSPFGPTDFRSTDGAVRRQAARFRLFRFDAEHPEGVPVDLDSDGIASVEWTVHVANKKASWYIFQTNSGEHGYLPDHPLRNADVTGEDRYGLIIDPGPRTLIGRDAHATFDRDTIPKGYPGRFPDGLQPYEISTLGEARTDAAGNLLVLGGKGRSGSTIHPPVITQYANNDGWFDDTSDGRVTARVVLTTGEVIEDIAPAWVVTGPPAYAPEIENIVTLYDTIFDALVRNAGYRPDIFSDSMWRDDYEPSFTDDILPLLRRPARYRWVVAIPPRPHRLPIDKLRDPDPRFNPLRQFYLDVLRKPSGPNRFVTETGAVAMPYLAGDNILNPDYLTSNFLTITPTQQFYLQQWAKGRFSPGSRAEQGAAALDRAVLENCVGGAFSPGIEVTWISRNVKIYAEPFRIKAKEMAPDQRLSLGLDLDAGLEPGDLAKFMACPWQADFNECSQQPFEDRWVWWWPAQRPLWVRPAETPDRQVAWVGTADDQKAPDYLTFDPDLDMVHKWKKLGFVVGTGEGEDRAYVEVQRLLPYAPGSGDKGKA